MSVRWLRMGWVFVALLIPAAAPGEIVRLKDQSTVRGRLVQVNGDTRCFAARWHAALPPGRGVLTCSTTLRRRGPVGGRPGRGKASGGMSRIEVGSRPGPPKVAIELKKDWDEHVAANYT
jgi:hypothetical protein